MIENIERLKDASIGSHAASFVAAIAPVLMSDISVIAAKIDDPRDRVHVAISFATVMMTSAASELERVAGVTSFNKDVRSASIAYVEHYLRVAAMNIPNDEAKQTGNKLLDDLCAVIELLNSKTGTAN